MSQSTTAHPCHLTFWGVRGSIPTPGPATVHYGGNTSCIEVRADGEIIILDAGSGIRPLGLALADEFRDRALNVTLLISHTHWDHIQGFPFFTPAYQAKNTVRILGYEGARRDLAQTIAGQMESPYFPVALQEMPGNIVIEELKSWEFDIGAVRVRACRMNHPGITMGYRLFTSAGSIAYLPDNEPAGSQPVEPLQLDGQPSTGIAEFVRGADVLVSDAQYDSHEYGAHTGWGHGCVEEVVKLAISAEVKRLFLFHHDPSHDDAKVAHMLEHARQFAAEKNAALRIDAAREGEVVAL
jgi:phosphoribosyl 1,2-cyclic phosphodiesterase